MREYTEREEQEMIRKAQAGDPEANYQMSFWALEQAAAEPEEERWNRLAAKCLVKAAEAGYPPARERMNRLLREMENREKAAAAPAPDSEPAREEEIRKAVPVQAEPETVSSGGKISALASGAADAGKTAAAKGRALLDKAMGLFSGKGEDAGGHAADEDADTAKWKKMQLMCTIACVVLLFLIVLMILTGREDRASRKEQEQMPAAAMAELQETAPSPTPEPYPTEEIRAAIEGALLDIFPAEEDYVHQPTTAVIDSGMGLRLRMGPATSYDQVVMMDEDAEVPVYAIRDDWAFVVYNDESYGWCSTEYLDIQ